MTMRDWKRHIVLVHGKIKPYKCSICDVSLNSKQAMMYHMYSVHEGKKPFRCSMCEKTYSSRDGLREHIKVNHRERENI
jgi:KRAB domain-containing zinc finger protein